MEFIEVSAKTVDEALTEASITLGIPSSEIEYEVVEKGSTGFLGLGSKNEVIKARKKFSVEDSVKDFLKSVFHAMDMAVEIIVKVNEEEKLIEVDLKGEDMMSQQMEMMNKTMPLMSLFFCFTLPVGLGIYWVISAAYRSVQQVTINKLISNMILDEII